MTILYCGCEIDEDGPCTVEDDVVERITPVLPVGVTVFTHMAVNPVHPYLVIGLRPIDGGRRLGDTCWHSTGSVRIRVYDKIKSGGGEIAALITPVLMDKACRLTRIGSYCIHSAQWPNTILTAEGVFVTQVLYGAVLRHPI